MVVVVGPTGIGKTRTAFAIASSLGGEVVVADSRQVYRRLDIATNKPPESYRATLRYHGIDLADPVTSVVSVHDWLAVVLPAIEDILARGRLPVVEGGSMLWVDALTEGFDLARVPPKTERRAELLARPREELAEIVRRLDPTAAIDFRNPARLVRAIEILEAVGPPLTAARGREVRSWRAVRLGLEAPPDVVERRLRQRSAEQIERGLLEETREALAAGVPRDHPVLSGIGYAEALACLEGRISRPRLAEEMLRSNRRYARRQLSWFKRHPATRWFEAEPDPVPAMLEFLEHTR